MYIEKLKDNDWKSFEIFVKKNLVKSFISKKIFNSFWFKQNNNWNIEIAKNDKGQIIAINMIIKTLCKFKNKKKIFVWTSTAFANCEARKSGIFALMIIKIHRSYPIIGALCGNRNSLPINKKLGDDLNGLKLRRFIFIHNKKILKILKKKTHKEIRKLRFKKIKKNEPELFTEWTNYVPKDIDKLWKNFSSQFDLCINKDYQFLKNRYEQSPYQKYNFIVIRNNKNFLIGLGVVRPQKTKAGNCIRIVEFMSLKGYEYIVWNSIILQCEKRKGIFSDFMVVGESQDKYLLKLGFKLANKNKLFKQIPNLLSPLEFRDWSYSFHVGGKLLNKIRTIKSKKKIWFTKGDGDRDWPTPSDIKN